MTNKEITLKTLEKYGTDLALSLQDRADSLTGTELYSEEEVIPDFSAAISNKNMLDREIGFVCKSSEGRVVKLLQPYDSTIYTDEPEQLPAQWGFAWSTDPNKALPFISIATSPYMIDDCCTFENKIYRSTIDNNVHSPKDFSDGWTEVTIEEM